MLISDHRANHVSWIIKVKFFFILDSTGYQGVGRENHSSNKDVTLTLQTELGLELLQISIFYIYSFAYRNSSIHHIRPPPSPVSPYPAFQCFPSFYYVALKTLSGFIIIDIY